jgi:hypothetical protein
MNLCKCNKFEIDNNEKFSLLKEPKYKIFGIYKVIKHSKMIEAIQNNVGSGSSCPIFNNKLNISKEASIIFNSSKKNKNSNIKINKALNYEKKKHKKYFNSNADNKINGNSNKRRLTFKNKNILVRPNFIDDAIINNKINKQENDVVKCNNENNQFIFNKNYNQKNNYINIYNNFISYSQFNEKENNFNKKIININVDGKSETKLKMPKFIQFEDSPKHFGTLAFNLSKNSFYNNNTSENNKFKLGNLIKNDNLLFQLKTEKNNSLSDDKYNSSNSTAQEGTINNNEENLKENISQKGKKGSSDNMMRKIKSKVVESIRLLINKILKDEIKYMKEYNFQIKEFRKIQGAFIRELNIKYNIWFYQIVIKDIFCLYICNESAKKSSNKELIDFLYSSQNINNFMKTKKLLETPFHQYYHDIFLGEDNKWKKYYCIKEKDNKFQIDYLFKNIEEENDTNYEIISLANNYENFFLEKKGRNLDYKNNKNEFIKEFMINTLNAKYSSMLQEVTKLKEFYENRKKLQISKNIKNNGDNFITIKNDLEQIYDGNYLNIINYKEIKKNENKKFIFYVCKSFKQNQTENNLTNNNMNLNENEDEEEKQENNQGNIFENHIKINEKYDFKNNEENMFCNKKREGQKIKYFISCKRPKNLDIKNKFYIKKN